VTELLPNQSTQSEEDAPVASRTRRVLRDPAAVLVLVGALVIRLIGIRGAFPYVYNPDEPLNMNAVRQMVGSRTLNPHYFDYPSLFFDVQAAVHGAYIELLHSGHETTLIASERVVGSVLLRDQSAWLLGRLVTVVLGVALVGCAMWLCRLLTEKRSTMIVAGVLVAANPILVRNSRWISPDMLAGLTATAAVAASVIVARNPSTRNYVLAGVAVGLSASAKYNVVVVGVALITAHVIARRTVGADHRKLIGAGLGALGAFLVTTPYALLDWHDFWSGVSLVVRSYNTGHLGSQGDSLMTNLRWLWSACGPFLLLPVAAVLSRSRKLLLIPGVFVVVYFAVVGAPVVRFERNLVPLLPSLLVLAALGVQEIYDRVRGWDMKFALPLIAALFAVVMVWVASLDVRDAAAALRDPRAGARAWVQSHVAAGGKVVVDGYGPWVSPRRYQVYAAIPNLNRPIGSWIELANPDAVVFTEGGSGQFLKTRGPFQSKVASELAHLAKSACRVASFNHGAELIRIYELHC
jgi:hypothetical protein